MFFVIGKRAVGIFLLACCCIMGLSMYAWSRAEITPAFGAFASESDMPPTVVIDPGHGGEDGGAVSPGGVQESHINLAISLRLRDLLRLVGQPTVLIRSEDISVHTEGETIRARKASDIRNRVATVEATENTVLLSIHQNSLPSSPVTHGAQTFWNDGEGAQQLAKVIQDSLNSCINTERPKQAKMIQPTIYLMNHVTAPAVLVECGFLTNEQETALLQQPSHQTKLAAAMTAGYLRALAGEEVP